MQDAQAFGSFEPSLTLSVLRGCRHCGAPHPLARTPPAPDGGCPDCGGASLPPETQTVPAVLVGDSDQC